MLTVASEYERNHEPSACSEKLPGVQSRCGEKGDDEDDGRRQRGVVVVKLELGSIVGHLDRASQTESPCDKTDE